MISWDENVAKGPTAMRAATEAKIGKADSDAFWELYRTNFVTREDLAAIKQWGFNSIRLPFNSNNLMPPSGQPAAAPYNYVESEIAWVDKGVQWASELGLYVILDMHGAPGGQNGNQIISDSAARGLFGATANDPPNPTYLARMVDLWKKLSQRYRSDPWVIGYDIMNEAVSPGQNGQDASFNAPILTIYKAVASALRADGDNKIMVAEAGWYGMAFAGIATSPMWDNNVMLEYHFYPLDAAAQPFGGAQATSQNLAYAANVPVWYGEGGENDNYSVVTKFVNFAKTTAGTSYSPHATHWAFWTTKKVVGTCFVKGAYSNPDAQPWKCTNAGEWNNVCRASTWSAANAATAKAGLTAMANALKTSGCTRLDAYITALGGTL